MSLHDYPTPWTYYAKDRVIIDSTKRPVCWLPHNVPSDNRPGEPISDDEAQALADRLLSLNDAP